MSANKKQAIACILSAAFFFAVMNLFVRLAGDLPVWQKSLFRNLMAFLIASAVILKNRHAVAIPKTQLPYMLIRCTAGTIGILCNFYAVSTINIADASMLNKLSPFFAILFSLIILKEKPKKLDWIPFLPSSDFWAVSAPVWPTPASGKWGPTAWTAR